MMVSLFLIKYFKMKTSLKMFYKVFQQQTNIGKQDAIYTNHLILEI